MAATSPPPGQPKAKQRKQNNEHKTDLGFSIFAGRDPLVFIFVLVLGPSLRSGDPVACLECINVGGGDSSLAAFGFLEVAGGEADAPLTWSLLCLGPLPGAGVLCDIFFQFIYLFIVHTAWSP